MCLILVVGVLTVPACGNASIEFVAIKGSSMPTTIVKGESLDTSDAVAVVKYSDESRIEVPSSELQFGEIDSSMVGSQKLQVSYKDFVFYVDITIVASEADVNSINSLSSDLIRDYNASRGMQLNATEEFYDKNQPIYVGDDNPFNFRISASGTNSMGELVQDIAKVRTKVSVEQFVDDEFVLLEGNNLNDIVSIDTENTTLDFTDKAIGSKFRVTVEAENRDTRYEENATKFSAVLEVIDGFNVYNAKELSIYDNVHNDSYKDIKSAVGIDGKTTNGIILQDNITITKEDVRPDAFYRKGVGNYSAAQAVTDQVVEGTPIDYSNTGLYERIVRKNETFNFIGNYFTISLRDFPKMVVEGVDSFDQNKAVNLSGDGSYMTAHMCVFFTMGTDVPGEEENSFVEWKNIFFTGNGELNTDPVNSGAILLMKHGNVPFRAYNTVMHNFYIGYFFYPETENSIGATYLVENCKGYNSYQTLFYVWGADNVIIKDSEFVSSGGPALIADHIDPDEFGNGGQESNIDLINTRLESVVTGKEPWFGIYGVDMYVAQLGQMDQLFSGQSYDVESGKLVDNGLPKSDKTIYAGSVKDDTGKTVNQINIIAVYKKNGMSLGGRIGGYFRVFDTIEEYNKFYGLNGEEKKILTYGLELDSGIAKRAFEKGATYISSNGSGGYISDQFDGKTNFDSTFIAETYKPQVLYQIIQGLGQTIPNYESFDLDEKKLALKGFVSSIGSLGENSANATLDGVYQAAVNHMVMFAVDDFVNKSIFEKQTILNDVIDNIENISYSEGDMVNVYHHTGLGITLGLYDKN